jgi:hypothetical protein
MDAPATLKLGGDRLRLEKKPPIDKVFRCHEEAGKTSFFAEKEKTQAHNAATVLDNVNIEEGVQAAILAEICLLVFKNSVVRRRICFCKKLW